MIIPSIDIMNGRAVQLRNGREEVLSCIKNPVDLAREFNRFGQVAVIDLDAALGTGDNLDLIKEICRVADVRVGGGIRNYRRADALLRAGADKLILGTMATPEFLKDLPAGRIQVALDSINGEIVDQGWQKTTGESIAERADRLAPYCSGFLCTFVENEGCLTGLPLEKAIQLKEILPGEITVAGGVRDTDDAVEICRMGLDVQVGMALYRGDLDLAKGFVDSIDFAKSPLVPTIAQDSSGQILMVANSTRESLLEALTSARGAYWSRSRQEIWVKGLTSGNSQKLIKARTDCDRDSIVFTIEQQGNACHRDIYSCFGDRRFSLEYLFRFLKQRKELAPAGSYTTKLLNDRKLLLSKIAEESQEVLDFQDRENLTWEIADLIYFLAVLAVDEGIEFADITAQLGGRHK